MGYLDVGLTFLPIWIAFYTYQATFSGEWLFVYDDNHNFVDILEISWDRIKWYFTEANVLGVYEPLSLTLKACFVYFIGWDAHAFHALATSLHVVNAALAYGVSRAFLRFLYDGSELSSKKDAPWPWGRAFGCALGTSLFACHSGSVQTICWLSCISYIFAAFFVQIGVLAVLAAVRPSASVVGSLLWRLLCIICGVFAIWCKVAAIPTPVFFCLIEWVALSRRAAREGMPWWKSIFLRIFGTLLRQAPGLVFAAWIVVRNEGGYHMEEIVKLDVKEIALRASYLVFFYFWKLVDPNHDYLVMQNMPYDGIDGFRTQCYAAVGALAVAVLIAAYGGLFSLVRLPQGSLAIPACLFAGWLVMIFPGLGAHSHTTDQLYADRYLYLPSVLLLGPIGGYVFASIAGPTGILSHTKEVDHEPTDDKPNGQTVKKKIPPPQGPWGWHSGALFAPMLAIVGFHAMKSKRNLDHWRTNRALWRHAAMNQPQSHKWWYFYAQDIADPGWPAQKPKAREGSVKALKQAAAIYPKGVYIYMAQGEHLHHLEQYNESLAAWEEALSKHSDDFEKQNTNRMFQLPSERYRIVCGLGRARLHVGQHKRAVEELQQCLQMHPPQISAVCTRRQEHDQPYHGQPALPQGVWWHQPCGERGKPGVLCAMPSCPKGCYTFLLGVAHFELHEWVKAAQSFQAAEKEKYPGAKIMLLWGVSLYHLQQYKDALQVWQEGMKRTPTEDEYKEIQDNLVVVQQVLAQQGG